MEGTKLEWKKVFKEIILGKVKNVSESNLDDEDQKKECSASKKLSINECVVLSEKIKPSNLVSNNASQTIQMVPGSYLKSSQINRTLPVSNCSPKSSSECSQENVNNVPEWEKVFKDILGNKPLNEESSDDGYIPPPVPYKSKKSRASNSKKSFSHRKLKMDKDREEVRKQFESWKVLKKQEPEFSFNDFEGAGINVFKYSSQQKDFLSVPKQCQTNSIDYDSCNNNFNQPVVESASNYRKDQCKDSYPSSKSKFLKNKNCMPNSNEPHKFQPSIQSKSYQSKKSA